MYNIKEPKQEDKMEPFTTEQINKQNSPGSLEYTNLEPGDMTRYQVLYGTYECPYYGTRYMLSYLDRSTGGRTFVWNDSVPIDMHNFMEKTGICNPTTVRWCISC